MLQPNELSRSPEVVGFLAALRVERSLAAQTLRSYQQDLEQFGAWLAAGNPSHLGGLTQADTLTVRHYVAELGRRGCKRRTIGRKLTAIRSLYQYLVRQGLMTANPVSGVPVPREQGPKPALITEQDVTQILELPDQTAASGLRDKALLELLYATGLRVRELVSLNLHTIDFEEGWLAVEGPGATRRSVPVGRQALEALEAYIQRGRPRMAAPRTAEEPLFLNKNGTRLSDRGVRRILTRYTSPAQSQTPVTPRSLRQAFASHLLARGAAAEVVQAMLGHARVESTNRYAPNQRRRSLRETYLSAHPRQGANSVIEAPPKGSEGGN